MKNITIGIIGAGRIGKVHAANIANNLKHVTIKTMADPFMTEETAQWAKSLGVLNTSKDYKDIINDKEIEAVLICSSTNTHADFSIEAAKAGKNIFCEKPISADVNKIKEVLAEVKKAGVKFQVGFNRRFDHNFSKVKDVVKSGKIGEVHIVKVTSRDPDAPPIEYVKVSGGMFLDMTIHDFDMVRFLSGSEVTEVYTSAAVLVNPEIGKAGDIDTAIVNVKFANGALGVIDNSRRAAYGYDQRVEVFGSKGSVVVSNDTDTSAVVSTEEGVSSDKPKYFFLERYHDSFINEMTQFFDAIEKGTEVPVGGIDGLMPVYIGMAAKKSYEENRPVKIDEIQALFE